MGRKKAAMMAAAAKAALKPDTVDQGTFGEFLWKYFGPTAVRVRHEPPLFLLALFRPSTPTLPPPS